MWTKKFSFIPKKIILSSFAKVYINLRSKLKTNLTFWKLFSEMTQLEIICFTSEFWQVNWLVPWTALSDSASLKVSSDKFFFFKVTALGKYILRSYYSILYWIQEFLPSEKQHYKQQAQKTGLLPSELLFQHLENQTPKCPALQLESGWQCPEQHMPTCILHAGKQNHAHRFKPELLFLPDLGLWKACSRQGKLSCAAMLCWQFGERDFPHGSAEPAVDHSKAPLCGVYVVVLVKGQKVEKTSAALRKVGFDWVIKSTVQLADTTAVTITVLTAFHLF